ncbi:MAG TPA: LuxR C-terminal-related transcriptional regulator [Gemmatimonadaceae bacterium]|nr:LuxR C-terminal-related transcriptional regulator [Gemmatimonadaceae bacterium]
MRQPRASEAVRSAAGTFEAMQRALEVLLSPTEYPDWRSWRREVHQRLLELTGAERMAIYTPLGSGDTDAWCVPGMTAEWGSLPHPEPGSQGVVRRLSGFVAAHSDTPTGGRAERGAGARPRHQDGTTALVIRHHSSAIITGPTHRPSQSAPGFEVAAVEVDFGGDRPALIAFTDGRRRWWRPDADRVASLKAVLPALKAGLASWRRSAEQRAELPMLVDALADATLVFDRGGTLVHANEAGRSLLAEADGARLKGEAQRLAWTVDGVARRERPVAGSPLPARAADLRVGATAYRLRGVLPPASMRGPAGAVLVTIERIERAPLTDDEIRTRFGLTARELEVARLVAQGLSNQEIADRLDVSFFTARNHVERLLVKLGVGNRARVAVVLAGG